MYRRKPAGEWRTAAIPEQRIVSDELWNSVQNRLKVFHRLYGLENGGRPAEVARLARLISSPGYWSARAAAVASRLCLDSGRSEQMRAMVVRCMLTVVGRSARTTYSLGAESWKSNSWLAFKSEYSTQTLEHELAETKVKLAISEPKTVRLRLRDTRRFVEARLNHLQSMLTGEPRVARAEIVRSTSRKSASRWKAGCISHRGHGICWEVWQLQWCRGLGTAVFLDNT